MTATCAIQPIDMVKVRLQLAGQGIRSTTGPAPTSLSITRELLTTGKFLDLYTGLSAGLLRQAVYTTARLGIFDTFMSRLSSRAATTGSTIGFKERAGAGLAAGGLAAMIGNPADLALIRMQSDGLKAVGERANYKSVFDALGRISGQEGIGALWAGAAPTVARAMALNFGQLAFFSEAKVRLKDSGLGSRTQTLTGECCVKVLSHLMFEIGYGLGASDCADTTLIASAIAGFFASFFSLPFDFVKTRLQKQTKAADGTLPYKSMMDCFAKVARDEGLMRFYRGYVFSNLRGVR